AGRSPFLRAILTQSAERIPRLNEGLNATAKILLLGIAIDVVYQFVEFDAFYPIESVLVALLLAFLPYCIIRGLVGRIWRNAVVARGNQQCPTLPLPGMPTGSRCESQPTAISPGCGPGLRLSAR